jgi:hypothetical protein
VPKIFLFDPILFSTVFQEPLKREILKQQYRTKKKNLKQMKKNFKKCTHKSLIYNENSYQVGDKILCAHKKPENTFPFFRLPG